MRRCWKQPGLARKAVRGMARTGWQKNNERDGRAAENSGCCRHPLTKPTRAMPQTMRRLRHAIERTQADEGPGPPPQTLQSVVHWKTEVETRRHRNCLHGGERASEPVWPKICGTDCLMPLCRLLKVQSSAASERAIEREREREGERERERNSRRRTIVAVGSRRCNHGPAPQKNSLCSSSLRATSFNRVTCYWHVVYQHAT